MKNTEQIKLTHLVYILIYWIIFIIRIFNDRTVFNLLNIKFKLTHFFVKIFNYIHMDCLLGYFYIKFITYFLVLINDPTTNFLVIINDPPIHKISQRNMIFILFSKYILLRRVDCYQKNPAVVLPLKFNLKAKLRLGKNKKLSYFFSLFFFLKIGRPVL